MSFILSSAGNTIIINCGGGSGGGTSPDTDNWEYETFKDVSGSSVTVANRLPTEVAQIFVYVNGIRQSPEDDYTVNGSDISFSYSLTGDNVLVQYKNQ